MALIITAVFIVGMAYLTYRTLQGQAKVDGANEEARKDELDKLKASYDAALQSGNKPDALQKGRAYYSFLRGGTLTIYDEQALANDLNAMN